MSLTGQTMGPVATDLNIGLRNLGVTEQKPEAKDGLSQNVKNGIGDDLIVNGGLTGAVCNTPDTEAC